MTTPQLLDVLQQGPILCKRALPPSEFLHLYSALVCGTPLHTGEERRLFLDSGLIHILVVSGAHLMFLESLLGFLGARTRMVLLAAYCWLTGFGAPVVKACARRVLESPSRRYGWSGLQTEAASVLICLIFVPEWLVSRSFLMSWICALTFLLPPLFRWKVLDQALKAFALLYMFCPSSPFTILWNVALAPLVGIVLFPASLLVVVMPWFTGVVDGAWFLFLEALRFGPKAPPEIWYLPTAPLLWWPIGVHGFLLWNEVRWRRARLFA